MTLRAWVHTRRAGRAPHAGAGLHAVLHLLRHARLILRAHARQAHAGGQRWGRSPAGTCLGSVARPVLRPGGCITSGGVLTSCMLHAPARCRSAAPGQARQPSASLQLLVRLLHAVRPDGFAGFRAFARWRGSACETLAAVLVWSTSQFRLQQVRAVLQPGFSMYE